MCKYSIGIDFGTLSARALLVNVKTGEELACAVFEYPHAVMDKNLPSGKKLGYDWALQHPRDYLDAISYIIPMLLKESSIFPDDIIGLGIDFTSCTILPVKANGTPICEIDGYRNEPHAYVKLWKHHAAQDKANKINEVATEIEEKWLGRYGNKISSEWVLPKIWEILSEAPEVYEEADYFMEAGDWVVWQLTGSLTRNLSATGFKAMWSKKSGYPDKTFFRELDPRLENVVEEKLGGSIIPLGHKAGEINQETSQKTGLNIGTPVAAANIDAHVTFPALSIDGPGKMLAIIGTSTCHILLGEEEHLVPGISGVVEDGVYPGFYGYEAGQASVGDLFGWFVENCVGKDYYDCAQAQDMDIHNYLMEKASELEVGQSGLIALDWWNGCRSTLVDADLTGMVVGMTLQTKPEEVYRALIEATAYGTKKIIDIFNENDVPVNEFYASGGIAQKNPLAMQIYADVINMPIKIGGRSQGPALGSAIFAAVAAGRENGGYDNIIEASRHMGKLDDKVYEPNVKNVLMYKKLYEEYSILHDYFGTGINDVMKRLKKYKNKGLC
ncbi:ribulokinase [Natronincola ferrireducens]|uniref:Ribulokinase n=1 Tax=Natronincola ferrireducens TaxID=393762 RepID=A0A1G9GIQ8_9FIRM|nr:ribulokinase [Natronincola ferrireducens]SDL00546.1 L-ribulokinase [Natronincola ferrireducens]